MEQHKNKPNSGESIKSDQDFKKFIHTLLLVFGLAALEYISASIPVNLGESLRKISTLFLLVAIFVAINHLTILLAKSTKNWLNREH